MSGDEVSRRALLGAAAALSFDAGLRQAQPLPRMSGEERRWTPDQVRGDGEWDEALAAFEAAQAAVGGIEAATAGYSLEDEEALLPAHEAACEAMEGALQRMLVVPAPHLLALRVKFEAAFDHELKHSPDDDPRFRAILQDIIGLQSSRLGCARRLRPGEFP